jgi:hypothetical protein
MVGASWLLGLVWPLKDRATPPRQEITAATLAEKPQRPITVLVIGIDADRIGDSVNGAAPRGPANSDALLLVRVNPKGPLQVLNLPPELAVNLPYGRKRALEIAATIAMDPELMLLDEPTQGMGHEDVDLITELIKKVSKGRTVLMVEHNMKVVANIATTISVLQRGEVIAEGSYEQVSKNHQVMEAYMGTADSELQGH